MEINRVLPTMTRLSSGKVLVTGGCDGDDYFYGSCSKDSLASAELYAPSTGRWTPTSSMGTRRSGQTATLLPDGHVLVSGGCLNACTTVLNTAELYDPHTGTWKPTSSMTTARLGQTATLLLNGQVLVSGGCHSSTGVYGCTDLLASSELYDPRTETWSTTGSMTIPRGSHTATLFTSGQLKGRVLIAGGCANAPCHIGLASAELYNPSTGNWSTTGSMSTVRTGHTMTMLQDGQVLVAGGCIPACGTVFDSAELYDPSTGRWMPTGSMTKARVGHTATLLTTGKVLIAGGYGPGCCPIKSLDSVELYDPASGTWTATASLDTGRYEQAATLLQDGQVLVAGGGDVAGDWSRILSSAELYSSSTSGPLPTPLPPPVASSLLPSTPGGGYALHFNGHDDAVLDSYNLVGEAGNGGGRPITP